MKRECIHEGCELPARGLTYCIAHLHRQQRGTDMNAPIRKRKPRAVDGKPPTCTHDGCSQPYYVKGYCTMHYHRQYSGAKMEGPHRRSREKRRLGKDGYVSVREPGRVGARKDGWIFEHRAVMEDHIGRPLLSGENVHHRNGVRSDNRIENLELWVTTQPAGQRPHDLVGWAREMLARYEQLDRDGLV